MNTKFEFEVGKVYAHRNMLDVAFLVYNTKALGTGWLLDVQWINTQHKFIIDVREDIEVLNTQIDNYYEVTLSLKD